MIDIEKERLRLLTQMSAEVPGNPHYSTLIRWALRGRRGVRLETVVVGGRRFTSAAAIHRFIARINEPGAVTNSAQDERRARDLDDVAKRLDKEGIGAPRPVDRRLPNKG